MRVEIDYCEACGGLGMAIEVRDAVIQDCGEVVEDVDLTPVDDGSFRVFVDGAEVFTTDAEEYDLASVTQTVCQAAK
ncbi:hypothetical protein GRX03_03520 [Halovenus sp. WSH3]|uniref:Selenoprotein n=1 Tax=Halovenus carboxidivorans TaxID=2692199 RepID=A0A6B0SY50_9EURY|nr:Rdx family protein [Halovenus carboxidivorans]MXR50678.1 hypothetical protein [Halovenus carboxidivorans]